MTLLSTLHSKSTPYPRQRGKSSIPQGHRCFALRVPFTLHPFTFSPFFSIFAKKKPPCNQKPSSLWAVI